MSARILFLAAFVATVVGIVVLAWYGFHSLDQVADGASQVRTEFTILRATASLEDTLRDLSAGPAGGDSTALRSRLDDEMRSMHEQRLPSEQRAIYAAFLRAVEQAKAAPSAETWFKAGEAIGSLEQSMIRRTKWADTEERAGDRARRLLLIGGFVVAVFGVASAVVYVRMRRGQRETQAHLRRSDRLAALGTIAASVAHEINNPLATISGCASAVRDRMKRRADPCSDSLEYLEMIEDETRRCSGIVKGLRDLARDGPPAMAPADLPSLARSVMSLLEMDRDAKRVTFTTAGAERLEAICDPDKVKQLLLNLLLNARDASRPGGEVTVRIETVGEIAARIEVIDHGRGIEKKDLQRIFEPFHTDKTQGLGIGLFLCERIAALHGGTIRADSEGAGKGARLVVEFPTRTASVVPAAAAS